MNQSTERELRELFAADAADAPDESAVAAAAVRRVHRRRRTLVVAAATTAVIVAAGVYGVHRPAATPQARPPVTSSLAPVASAPAADLPAGVKPGDPLAVGEAQCVKTYSPRALAEQAFAFDGTVTGIGPARTGRGTQPPRDLRSVTFQVHTWFRGGSAGTAVVDMSPPAARAGTGDATSEHVPAYRIGTRLLVSGTPRWGGAPLADPIAWGCGFTRYYSPSVAAGWTAATR
ncbi:hypothetical protein [Micromonospora humi]|uniref:Uncharacterized protein n=1 Tax=Micromonospora humi TaxID=745366 RepID=A0A1C5H247_9ACTN|nr:hypothetical protein [Micromonospora humi]SCG40084.1 hypothetical protein GA0070213_102181 [Micromonospora humi]